MIDRPLSDPRASAPERLIMGWTAGTCLPLPGEVRAVARAWLERNPSCCLEYMGRGRFHGKAPAAQRTIYLDIPGGRRAYAFRAFGMSERESDPRLIAAGQRFGKIAAWLDDSGSRVVLSMGGGGYRLFAAHAGLRTIENLVHGKRTTFDEVWGTSGGALLGYAFAEGHDLGVIEELGYRILHSRTPELFGVNAQTALYMLRRFVRGDAFAAVTRPELAAWVDMIDRLCPVEQRKASRAPFFALVSNTRWRYPVALTAQENVEAHCQDILIPCSPSEAAGASMAVPFFTSPFRGSVLGFEKDSFFDGGIVEENPITLPVIKWLRDRKRDPERTPKRLKILILNLNTRLAESALARALPNGRIKLAGELLDLLLDSKTHALVRTLSELDEIEIVTATLNLGLMSFISRRHIPALIRTGQIIEGWDLDLRAIDGGTRPGVSA